MKKLLYLTIGTLLIYSCSKEDIASKSSPVTPSETEVATTDGMTVLGNQLENPYSVNNMRRALANLAPATRSGIGKDQIQATHHYVKFHPKTNAELDLLKQDSTILLYEYPLDYDIEVYGAYYHSPEIPDSQPTFQYASIDVEKWDAVSKIPVEFTILEELFIPDEDKDDAEPVMTRSGKVLDNALIDALVDEALKITGNEEPMVAVTRASKWRPAGWITYYDESLRRNIGVEGVKVKARRWFTTHTGFVNTSGYYSCDGTFKRPANYSFDFERYEFHVKGDGVRTDFDGPKKKGNWDYHFARTKSETEFAGATAFRAAYHYYYKNIGGLRRPPQNSFWKAQMNIKVFNQSGTNNAYPARRWFDGNPVKLYLKGISTINFYATTIHELAHSAHWNC